MSLQSRLFSELVTFTRASSGWRFNELGTFEEVLTDLPRFDFDPVTLAPLGLMIEPRRTNVFLNTATPATQSVTVTATDYTLSFTGTGTVTLSGAYAGTLTGTGPTDRVTLTFAPSAGTLTLTVSGTIVRPQLEKGIFATSHIPVAGTAVTRAADSAHTLLTDFAYNANAGTLIVNGNFTEGQQIIQLGAFEIVADETGNKSYTLGYDITPGGDRIQLGLGTFRSVAYYPTAFGDITSTDNPVWLFTLGEAGTVLDFSPTQVFSDTTGLLPAELGQGIALTLDKSPNGTDATQATSTARPIFARVPVGGRRNLLERTEEFDNAYWLKTNVTVTANSAIAPNGSMTADLFVASLGATDIRLRKTAPNKTDHIYTVSVYAKQGGFSLLRINPDSACANVAVAFDLVAGVFTETSANTLDTESESLGDGWYRISLAWDMAARLNDTGQIVFGHESPGDGTSGIYIWGAQLEVAS